jgi:hypothetical protein
MLDRMGHIRRFGRAPSVGRRAFGGPDPELVATGDLAHGTIKRISPSSRDYKLVLTREGIDAESSCVLQVQVVREGDIPYSVTTNQDIPAIYLEHLKSGIETRAVWVAADDRNRIWVDVSRPAPVVRMGPLPEHAPLLWIAERGKPVTVTVVSSYYLGFNDALDRELHSVTVMVFGPGAKPYRLSVENPVSADGMKRLYPGSRLPARRGYYHDAVVIDFDAEHVPL